MAKTGLRMIRLYMASIGQPISRSASKRDIRKLFLSHIYGDDDLPQANIDVVGRACLLWLKGGVETKEAFEEQLCVARKMTSLRDRQMNAHKQRMKNACLTDDGHRAVVANLSDRNFYLTDEWKTLRYAAFERYGNFCSCCGRGPEHRVVLHVDHIKPRSMFPELALDPGNLQVLCEDCNRAKSNIYMTDWRQKQGSKP